MENSDTIEIISTVYYGKPPEPEVIVLPTKHYIQPVVIEYVVETIDRSKDEPAPRIPRPVTEETHRLVQEIADKVNRMEAEMQLQKTRLDLSAAINALRDRFKVGK